MVSTVIGNELVPYDANLNNRGKSSPSTSSSILIDSTPPTEDEDYQVTDNLNGCNSSSESETSLQGKVVDKNSALVLFERHEVTKEVDSAFISQVLEDHQKYPPQRTGDENEDTPATREKLNYFLKVLMLKISKYHKLSMCRIPPSLKTIPLALSYETFITLYWPGALSCCQRLFKSAQSYSTHYYKQHKPLSPPLHLSCINSTESGEPQDQVLSSSQPTIADLESDNSSDIISLPDDTGSKSHQQVKSSQPSALSKLYRQQFGRTNDMSSAARKRKTLSPTSRPGPLSHKQQKLNQTVAVIDSSLVESGDEAGRPKRARKRRVSQNDNDVLMDQLNSDQMRFVPQHEPGAPENFPATTRRIDYFLKVLSVKLEKYHLLNSNRPNSPSRHIPLALSLAGFMQYYWPGKVMCCGTIRENAHTLERHISRCHRPPRGLPVLTTVPPTNDEVNEDSDGTVVNQSKDPKADSSEKTGSKSPPGFQADQHRFPPQHKPGESEDFMANQESIDYFVEVLTIKREKYAHMAPIKDKPLSSSCVDFVLNYWPGVLSCCDRVYSSSKEFAVHLTGSHLPPKKIPQPTVVDPSAVPPVSEPLPVVSSSEQILASPPHSLQTSPQRSRRKSGRLAIEQASSQSQQQPLSIFSTPAHQLMINSIQEEARQLRTQTTQVSTLSGLIPLLERLLDLMATITSRIRGVMDVEARSQAIECLEYVYNASKTTILRWEDLKGRTNRDSLLNAVQYAYGTLPVWSNWEQNKHLEMLENVTLLCLNTVKNWSTSSSQDAKLEARRSSTSIRHLPASRRRSAKSVKSEGMVSTSPDSDETITTGTAATAIPPKDAAAKNMAALLDFCRLANIAIGQNTKARANTGYKDDNGRYHTMYRYGIKALLKLFCPTEVTHLKCCDQDFDLANLVEHVLQFHDGSQPDHSEPSISPI